MTEEKYKRAVELQRYIAEVEGYLRNYNDKCEATSFVIQAYANVPEALSNVGYEDIIDNFRLTFAEDVLQRSREKLDECKKEFESL